MARENQPQQFELEFNPQGDALALPALAKVVLNDNGQPGVFIKPTWEDFERDVEAWQARK